MQFDYEEFKMTTKANLNTLVTLEEYRNRNMMADKKFDDVTFKISEQISDINNKLESCEHYEEINDRKVKNLEDSIKLLNQKLDGTITYINQSQERVEIMAKRMEGELRAE